MLPLMKNLGILPVFHRRRASDSDRSAGTTDQTEAEPSLGQTTMMAEGSLSQKFQKRPDPLDVQSTPPKTNEPRPVEEAISSWDPFYDNPAAELILVSSDEVGFRVDAWTFSKRSQFVKDLLDVPSREPLRQAPCQLNQPAEIVRVFIDLALVRAGSISITLPAAAYHGLYQLCDQLQAPGVKDSLTKCLRVKMAARVYPADLDAWEIYKIAAREDDAIESLGYSGYTHRSMFFDDPARFIFADIPTKYALALYRSAFSHSEGRQIHNPYRKSSSKSLTWVPNEIETLASNFLVE